MGRQVAKVAVLVAVLLAAGCGGGSGGPDNSGGTVGFSEAASTARNQVSAIASDAILVSAGNAGGLALADVPETWSFTYYSPSTKQVYAIVVDHGVSRLDSSGGGTAPGRTITSSIDPAKIAVGADDAVRRARAFGEKSGAVPKNVVVAGAFADVEGGAAGLGTPGVWTVTFATGTDLSDALKFDVDMASGAVSRHS